MFIPDPDLDFLPIPDPGSRIQGSKKAPDPGSLILIRNTDFCHDFIILANWNC
jgi:hypothetical protein